MDTTTEETRLQGEVKRVDALSLDTLFDVISTWHVPLLMFAVIRGLPSAMMFMAVVFSAPESQNFHCVVPPGWTPNEEQCTMQRIDAVTSDGTNISTAVGNSQAGLGDVVDCSAWTFDRTVFRGTTLVEEWDLVCSRRWMVSTAQSLYILGLVFSSTIFSHVADWYGRKRACVISLVFSLLIGGLLSWSPSMSTYNVLRFLAAASASGYYDAATIQLVESVSANKRYLVTLTAGVGWSGGMILLPVVSYLTPNWRTHQLIIAAPFIVLLVLTFFMDESPRWLLETGRFSEARAILIKVLQKRQKNESAPTEQRDNLTIDELDQLIEEIKTRSATKALKGKGTIANLFGKRFRHPTIVFCYSKMIAYLLWYHVTVSSVTVGLNPFLSFGLAALCELPNRALDAVIVRVAPRRVAATVAFAITACAMSVYYFFSDGSWVVRLSCLVLCRLCMDVHGSVQKLQLAELYPSRLRSLIAGLVYNCANLAGLLSPFINYLGQETFQWIPSVAIVSLCLIGSLATLTVKETFGRDLHEENA